jgi:drug/metabolite transporter (DMT)-like permease
MLATCFWGSSFIAIRMMLDTATAPGVVWTRNLLAAVFLLVLLHGRGAPLLPLPADRPRALMLGLIFGMHQWLQSMAMERTSAMRAGWIVAFIPAVVALGAWRFQGQRMRAIGWLGILAASAGVFVLTATRPAGLAEATAGDLMMLGSTLTWAAYTLLSVDPARRSGSLSITAAALWVAAVPNGLLALHTGTWHAAPGAGAIAALCFLGIGASGLSMWLFTEAVAEIGPERGSAFQYVQPLVTVAAAHLMLAERITAGQLLAGPVILAGVWLVQRGKRGPG